MTGLEKRWARVSLGVMFPRTEAAGVGLADLDVDAYLGDLTSRVPWHVALGIRAAIWMVALSPLFVIGRFSTIVSLSSGERESVLTNLASSSLYAVRQLVVLLKTLGAILFASAPQVRAVMLRERTVVPPAESGPRLIQLGKKDVASGAMSQHGQTEPSETQIESEVAHDEDEDEQSVA